MIIILMGILFALIVYVLYLSRKQTKYVCLCFKKLDEKIKEVKEDMDLKENILWEAMETTCDKLGDEVEKLQERLKK